MGFDTKSAVVIRIHKAGNGQWDVSEVGFEQPLASFDDAATAMEYARDIARTKGGAVIETDAAPPQ